MDVSYTPNSEYSTFDFLTEFKGKVYNFKDSQDLKTDYNFVGRSTVGVKLTLNFTEIELLTQEDMDLRTSSNNDFERGYN
jgi:hypothetical protein